MRMKEDVKTNLFISSKETEVSRFGSLGLTLYFLRGADASVLKASVEVGTTGARTAWIEGTDWTADV